MFAPDELMNALGFERAPTLHVFIGAGPHVGKTTMAKKFAEEHGLKRGSTSDVVIRKLAEILSGIYAGQPRLLRFSVFYISRNKERFRWLLEATGDKMCKDDPACLAGALAEQGCEVIDGIRRWRELRAVMKKFNVVTHWVERKGYPKTRDNTDIRFEDIEWDDVIYNDYEETK